ncbi:amidohydrolase family protein [Actinocorallia sp. A-T 12471]|uniref:amidohydrolase family protein n=1 Tax=Actinocorallia sp. A-T 12471 TaxID=3089813 RepID=UPI0029CF63E4|nr:amidohydrolase family protein [Actinocorallia sp. A-T 12471]MDX6743955.1 amidohydrolase family protein [Actinocorallia sp. A-T 12471]
MSDPLIDVHAHFVTDAYVAAARAAGHVNPDGMPAYPSWSQEAHLRVMDEHGIAVSLLSISSPGTHFGDDAAARALSREVNLAGARVVADHPDRFGHFASLPLPDVEGSLAEAVFALDELGSDGVVLQSNAHGRYLGDAAYEPLWAELDRRAAAVFVHPTSPPGAEALTSGRPRPVLEFLFDTTRTATDLALTGVFTRYPRINWILTHCGGTLPLLADRIEMFRTLLLGGTADQESVPAQLARQWFDLAGTPFPNQAAALSAAFGTRGALYGSDFCWTPAPAVATQIASLDAASPPPEGGTWRTLTTANARTLFPRLKP